MLNASREGFRKYLKNKDRPWKYEALADIVNNSWHIYHKDISTYAALSKAS